MHASAPTEPKATSGEDLILRAHPSPAFSLREEYTKLLSKDNPSLDNMLRWLTEVNRTFNLDRNNAEVMMSSITSCIVYIFQYRTHIPNPPT